MILEQIKNPDFFNNSEQNMIYFLQKRKTEEVEEKDSFAILFKVT